MVLSIFGSGKKEEPKSSSDPDDLSDKANLTLKIQGLLARAEERFGEKYKDLQMHTAFPALLKLIGQAKAQQTGEFARDQLCQQSGPVATPKGEL